MKLPTSLLLILAGLGAAACSSENTPSMDANGGKTSTASGGATSASGGATTAAGGATSASGGATTAAGGATTGTGMFTPTCDGLMAGGVAIAKGVACTAADPQICYKTCGPASVGFKAEMCSGTAYAEGDCQFPTNKDYACYKVPAAIDHTTCGAATPKASTECTVPTCTLCNDANGAYLDSSGNSKTGYCVCPEPSAAGTRKWTCASATAWPCPLGQGC